MDEDDIISRYAQMVVEAYEFETDDEFSDLISLNGDHIKDARELTTYSFVEKLNYYDDSTPIQLAQNHLQALERMLNRDPESALDYQIQLVQSFIKEFQDQKDDNWGIRTINVICQDMRRIAVTASLHEDPILRSEEGLPNALEKAADVIMALFRICAGGPRANAHDKDTKRWGVLLLVNQLFKIYFRLNRLQLCKPLIRAIETQFPNSLSQFPIDQTVTYNYYVGRKAMFDSDFRDAESSLTFAFENCSPYPDSPNKRRILTCLIPVKMFLGWLPTEETLTKYNLLEFLRVATALKNGCVREFDNSLRDYQSMFTSEGVFFTIEKLRSILYRNLFKKVCLLHDGNQVPIYLLEAALRWSGYDEVDEDEVQCILSNLIFDGQIRGYISHQHQVLVIAKTNPFPKIHQPLD